MDSTSRPSRLSRIAMPRRLNTNDHLKRASSTDMGRESHIPHLQLPKIRSSTCTPTRTPLGTGPRPSHLMMTSERKNQPMTEDKRMIQTCIARVMECVRNIRELGNDFVTKGGLKSMTAREFIVIINHIIKQINAKANFTTNYSDELHKFLMLIEYPYSVNKSWFKTPNAPHSFNHIVVMLNYLLDFLPWDAGAMHEYDVPSATLPCETFPNAEYTTHFRKQMREMYHMWNSENDSEGTLKQDLKDDLIKATTNGEFKDMNDLAAAVARQEKEVAAIVPVPPMDENQISGMEQLLAAKTTELNNLIQLNKETSAKNARLLKELKDIEGEIKTIVDEEDRLKKVIGRQIRERAREKFENMSLELAKTQAELQGKMIIIDRMSTAHYNKMLLHTKLVDKRSNLLSSLTLKLMDLKTVDEVRNVLQLDDLGSLESLNQLENLKQQLGSFSSTVLSNRRVEMEAIEKQLNELKNLKIAYQEGLLQKSQERLEEMKVEHAKLQQELVQVTLGHEKYHGNLQTSIRQLEDDISEQQRLQTVRKSELEKLEAEKRVLLAETKKKIAFVLDQQQKSYDTFKQDMRTLNGSLRQLRDA